MVTIKIKRSKVWSWNYSVQVAQSWSGNNNMTHEWVMSNGRWIQMVWLAGDNCTLNEESRRGPECSHAARWIPLLHASNEHITDYHPPAKYQVPGTWYLGITDTCRCRLNCSVYHISMSWLRLCHPHGMRVSPWWCLCMSLCLDKIPPPPVCRPQA